MPAPKKYESTKTFLFHIESNNFKVIAERAYMEHKSTTEKLNEIVAQEVERIQVMQPQEVNPLGLNYHNNTQLTTPKAVQPSYEEQRAIKQRNVLSAIDELAPFLSLSQMDADTFKKFKDAFDKKLYSLRNRDNSSGLNWSKLIHNRVNNNNSYTYVNAIGEGMI